MRRAPFAPLVLAVRQEMSSLAELLRRDDLVFDAKPRAVPLLRLPAELAPKAVRLAETIVAYQLNKADDESLQKLLRDVIKKPELRVCARRPQRSASSRAFAPAARSAG